MNTSAKFHVYKGTKIVHTGDINTQESAIAFFEWFLTQDISTLMVAVFKDDTLHSVMSAESMINRFYLISLMADVMRDVDLN